MARGWLCLVSYFHCMGCFLDCVASYKLQPYPCFRAKGRQALRAVCDGRGCALQIGSRAVAKRSSVMDGQLFLIKQLLILREQIAPFEADFTHVEKDLDFTHMRDHLRRIMAGARPLLSLIRPPVHWDAQWMR